MANGSVTIDIDGDSSGLESSIRDTTNTVEREVKKQKKTWDEYAKETGKSFDEIKKDVDELARKFQQEGKSIPNSYKAAYKEIGICSAREMGAAEDDVESLGKKADTVAKGIKTGFNNAFKAVGTGAKTALTSFNNFSTGVGNTVKTAFTVGTVAAAGLGTAMVAVGQGFEAQMSTVSALSGASADDLDVLTAKAKQLGIDTAFSATEAGKAFEYMALAGWDTESMLQGIDGVMSAAAASGEDLGLVSDIVTDSLTAFGQSASESGRLADILAATASNSNTNISGLGEALKYAAPVAGSFGYSMEDTATALGLMANAGIKGSQAGTTMRGALSRLLKPSKEAASYMDQLGISISNADGTMKPLDEVMNTLRTSMDGLTDAEKNTALATIFGQEALSGMLAIVNTSDEDYNKLAGSINNATGASEEMAEVKLDNLAGQLTLLKSSTEGLALAFYDLCNEDLTEGVKSIIGVVNELTTAMSTGDYTKFAYLVGDGLSQAVNTAMEKLPQFVDIGVNVIASFLEGIIDNLPQMVESGSSVIKKLAEGLTTLMPQIAQVAEGIIPLIVEGVMTWFAKIWELSFTLITAFAKGISDNLPQLVSSAQQLLQQLVSSILENLPILVESAVNIINAIVQFLVDNLGMILDAGMQIIEALLNALIENIPTLVDAAVQILTTIVNFIAENISMLIEAGIQIILALAMAIIDNLPTIIDSIVTLVMSLAQAIIDNLPLFIDAALQIILALTFALIENLPTVLDAILEICDALAEAIIDNLPLFIDAAIQIILAIIAGLVLMTGELLGYFMKMFMQCIDNFLKIDWIGCGVSILTGIWNGIKNIGAKLVEWWSTWINGIVTKIKNTPWYDNGVSLLTKLWNGVKAIVGNVVSTFGTMITNIITKITSTDWTAKGREVITKIKNGISNTISSAVSKVTSLVDKIKNAFKIDWGSIGSSIIEGVKNGITRGVSSITTAAKNMANAAFNAAKNVLKINSPSKVFRDKIGSSVSEGMAVGITKNSGLAVDAVGNVSEDMLDKAHASLADVAMNTFKGSYESIGRSLAGGLVSNTSGTVTNNNTTREIGDINITGMLTMPNGKALGEVVFPTINTMMAKSISSRRLATV